MILICDVKKICYTTLMIRVASSLPGRLRLRGTTLRDTAQSARLRARVAGWQHVSSVEANPRTGSLLVHYAAARLDPARFAARILHAAGQDSPVLQKAAAEPRAGSPRGRANRLAKRGMLLSLTASLLLAGAGFKRWHALTGVLFLHALAVHLWVHRRHVLR